MVLPLKNLVKYFPKYIKKRLPKQVAVIDISAKESWHLNKLYCKKNKPTNVLSFRYGPDYGEILLCPEVIKKEAILTIPKETYTPEQPKCLVSLRPIELAGEIEHLLRRYILHQGGIAIGSVSASLRGIKEMLEQNGMGPSPGMNYDEEIIQACLLLEKKCQHIECTNCHKDPLDDYKEFFIIYYRPNP